MCMGGVYGWYVRAEAAVSRLGSAEDIVGKEAMASGERGEAMALGHL